MKRIKIILVDDHQLFLDGLKATLNNDSSIKVIQTFTKATKALSYLKNTTVDRLPK